MSYSVLDRINVGAYQHPFSGVGIEYYPLGAELDHTGLLIHEVGFLPQNGDWNFPSVLSPFWRLYYNSRHGHCVSFGNTFYELTPDQIMLIPNHQLFHCLGAKPVPTFWMAFATKQQIDLEQTVPILLEPTQSQLSLISDTQKLISKNHTYEPTDAIYRYSLAILNTVMANAEIKWKSVHPPSLDQALSFIENNLSHNLSNSRLAEVVCLSIEGLSKLFRKHLGISPSAYVTQMRIKEAGRLLSQTEMSIEQIAATTGFPNRNYFTRVFKKITKESPAKYRRLHRNFKKRLLG